MPRKRKNRSYDTDESEGGDGDDDEHSEFDPEEDGTPSSDDTGSVFQPDGDDEEESLDGDDDEEEENSDDDDDFIVDDSKPKKKKNNNNRKKSPAKSGRTASVASSPAATATTTSTSTKEEMGAVTFQARPSKKRNDSSTRRKKKKKIIEIDEEEDKLAPSDRKTANGGYRATSRSRAKIQAANTGKWAWNEGKSWSNSVKTKIALGVQARNRVILLEKLKRFNMTEEEWNDIRKKTKYIREKIRKLRNKNKEGKTKTEAKDVKLFNERRRKQEERRTAELAMKEEQMMEKPKPKLKKTTKDIARANIAKKLAKKAEEVFPREIKWSPLTVTHDATVAADITTTKSDDEVVEDTTGSSSSNSTSFDYSCPEGGPGGFICCEACSQRYSTYLSRTSDELQVARTQKVAREVEQLMDILKKKQKELKQETRDATMGRSRQQQSSAPTSIDPQTENHSDSIRIGYV